MEYILLYKVGMIIKGLVWSSYTFAGGYMAKAGVKYISDYRESVARDREVS